MATASSCRRIGTTAERLGYANTGIGLGDGFERYRLIATIVTNNQRIIHIELGRAA